MSKLQVGDQAADFVLTGTLGDGRHRDYSLKAYRGRPVVLVFYPADNSPVCTAQLGSYNDNLHALSDTGAQVLGISPQSIESHDSFHKNHGPFSFPLLADPGKEVGERYGVLGPLGFYRRSIFVVAPDGTIAYAHRSITSLSYQPVPEILAAVHAAEPPDRPEP